MSQRHYPEYGPMQRRRSADRTPTVHPSSDQAGTRPFEKLRRNGTQPLTRRGAGGRWLKLVVVSVFLLVGAAFAGIAWLDQHYAERIYPNIFVQGVAVGQQTQAEATQRLQTRFAALLESPITLTWEDRRWQPSLQELGATIEIDQAVAAAYRAGRSNGLVQNVQDIAAIYQQGRDLPVRISVDQATLLRYVQRIAVDVEQPGREATLALIGTDVQTSPSSDGRMVLLDDTASAIVQALRTLQPAEIALRTAVLRPQLTDSGIAEAQRTARAMLAAPLVLSFNDTAFELDQATLADMLTIQRVAGDTGTQLRVQLDQAKLEKWVTRLADTIGRASVEPRVAWNGGNLQIVQEGRIGYRLDIPATVELITATVTTDTRTLDLPVDEVQPHVRPDTLASLGITEVVGTGKSDFAGSADYRITNIKAGARIIDGILVAPGEEFSFNTNVGEINEANGFVEGYAIVGNRTQLEPGGGICQISTTLFRAAFYAGLPFTEKNPHRFRISWYEKYDTIGMDAAIFTGGGPDLRFTNDTGNWILIESSVNDAESSVTYTIYGTNVPGRTVERSAAVITNQTPAPTKPVYVDDPEIPVGQLKQTDTARGGMDVTIQRVIKQDGAVVSTNTFVTPFAAWPNIYLKHPQTPAPAGS